MGCVSSTLLNQDNEFTQMGGSAAGFSHHIVSLTSTTYGLLTLDPPSSPPPSSTPTTIVPPTPTPPPRHTLGSLFPSPLSEPRTLKSHTSDIINSWELMAGLDSTSMTPISDSFRFSTLLKLSTPDSSFRFLKSFPSKENSSPNIPSFNDVVDKADFFKPTRLMSCDSKLDGFENLCPPNGEDKIVIYTTTLRGVRRTFEACNAVRSAIEGLGVLYSERDISMDRGFRDELKELMKGKKSTELIPPRVFFKGRYIGGAEEVMRIVEEGNLGDLLQGLPKVKAGFVCDGCGGVRFLPCFACNGSCKMVMVVKEDMEQKEGRTLVVKCTECNENGLVLCPICC
ncbi:uncharacterized protein At5g39865-like [Nicotiana tomentosiformis]|uniref:uncharacterized protein At5g39865-like n=1 Tax=Nicotiana tomentosiformis TaxID=4098 RepID=UPI00051BEEB5|nr:uncharacterized protein At5g39865-like [Nicotiana tomentosiformis]